MAKVLQIYDYFNITPEARPLFDDGVLPWPDDKIDAEEDIEITAGCSSASFPIKRKLSPGGVGRGRAL